jgi:RimJ/RimL family protein N-acetyltransferase
MERMESKRLVLRNLEQDDFNDFWELSKNWKEAPGPAFDKFPVSEKECRDCFEYSLKNPENSCHIYLRDKKRIIGLICLNGIDENGYMDMGHIIHSDYQNNDIDKEALSMVVNHVLQTLDIKAIITNNDPNIKQNAPLYSIGFTDRNNNGGELILKKLKY